MAIRRDASRVVCLLSIIIVHTAVGTDPQMPGGTSVCTSQKQQAVSAKKKYIFNRRTPVIDETPSKRRARYPEGVTHASQWMGGVMKDMFLLNRNLIAWDSFAIIASVFPFFVGARMIDEPIQMYFYDPVHHKNKRQLPHWCHDACKLMIGAPILLLGSQAFLSKEYEMRQTSRMLLLGLPFVIWGKTLIKKFKFDACLRPWNEKFSCEQRAYGGFPSGHVSEATYTAVLYGMRYGPAYSIPLGLLAATIGVTFVSCNRHLLSQVIAGAGLGAIYGVAANRVIDDKMRVRDLSFDVSVADNGQALFGVSYRF
jgi:membrane-associated phospholipid phosphatase